MPAPPPTGATPQARGSTPLLDRRQGQHWRRQLPGRLGTGALWCGAFSLFGPIKLAGLLLGGTLLSTSLLLIDRQQRQRPSQRIVATALATVAPPGLARATVAEEVGLAESQLFRARHARICTVHHDSEGRISGIELPDPTPPFPLPRRDAHPVG